jgi:hypothetical protein
MQTEDKAQRPWYRRARYVLPLAVVLVLLAVSLLPLYPRHVSTDQKALNKTVLYFAKSYDKVTGLVPEVPNGTTFWIYSDNYLATLALHRYDASNSSTRNFATAVEYAFNGYAATLPPGVSQNPYSALNSTTGHFGCTTNYTLTWSSGNMPIGTSPQDTIKTTSVVPTGDCASQDYADILFLQAINAYKNGDVATANQDYALAKADFDGKGLADLAYTSPASSSFGIYQTYKVALYVYADKCMAKDAGDPNFSLLNSTLIHMQDKTTGGFYAGYDQSLDHGTTTVNTETTALVALALEEILNPSIGC